MPIPNELLANITGRLDPERGPALVGDALALWQTIFRKFGPLLGPLASELLFVRSLEESEAHYPWLRQATAAGDGRSSLEGFERCLGGRAPHEVVAVNAALLRAYTGAMEKLIGERLTVRFLRAGFPDDEA